MERRKKEKEMEKKEESEFAEYWKIRNQEQRAAQEKAAQKKNGFLSKLLNGAQELTKDTCETNWDCERPQVCCDFGFKKMCCSSGNLVGNSQPQLAPVPVVAGYPPEVRKNY